MRYPVLRAIWVIAFFLAMTSVILAQDASKRTIRVNGAGISADQVDIWANSFMKANPGVNILITGSSAGKGLESLLERNAEIAMASRVVSPDEEKKAVKQGIQLGERLIGYSGIAVITTPKNTLSELTMEQLRRIFAGEYTNWKQVGGLDAPIRCFTRRVPESGAATFFQEKVLVNQPYGNTTTMTETWPTIIKVCSMGNDLSIGIAPVSQALAASGKIKILRVKEDEHSPGVAPSYETLKNKTYPIILPFRFYWDDKTSDDQIKRFIEFCANKGLTSEK